MKKTLLTFLFSVAISGFFCNSLSAQDKTTPVETKTTETKTTETKTTSGETKTTETKTTETKTTSGETINKELPTAIKIGIIDGIVRYVSNDKRIKVQVEWEPLPVTGSLIKQSGKYNFVVNKFKASNQEIESGEWVNKIPGLQETSIDPLERDTIRVSEFMQMRREQNVLTAILKSRGGEYSFGLRRNKDSISPPNFSDKKIDWHIDVYTFITSDGGKFYRFTAKAVVEPFDVNINDYVSDNDNKNDNKNFKMFYDARFKLKESQYISQIANEMFVNVGSQDIPIPTLERSDLPKSEDLIKSLTSLSGFFSIVGGADRIGVVTEGLLGGTKDTSIVSGGLIGDGGVSALVGVNREVFSIGDDTRGGILLGLGLGDKTSLYLGPSLQYSAFTISAGARIGTQNTDVNLAGMVAVDLSRLTNSKKDNLTPVTISDTGGGLDKKNEEIIDKYTLLQYEQLSKEFILTRVCNEKGNPIPESEKKNRNIVNLKSKQPLKRIYLPRGVYRYTSTTGKKAYQQLLEDKLVKFEPPSNQAKDSSDSCDP